jgi:hypothetical protein
MPVNPIKIQVHQKRRDRAALRNTNTNHRIVLTSPPEFVQNGGGMKPQGGQGESSAIQPENSGKDRHQLGMVKAVKALHKVPLKIPERPVEARI